MLVKSDRNKGSGHFLAGILLHFGQTLEEKGQSTGRIVGVKILVGNTVIAQGRLGRGHHLVDGRADIGGRNFLASDLKYRVFQNHRNPSMNGTPIALPPKAVRDTASFFIFSSVGSL